MTYVTFEALMVLLSKRSKFANLLIPFQGVSWSFTGVALALTVGRYWVRSTIIRRVGWDDAAHLLGVILLVSQVAIVTTATSMMYKLGSDNTGGSAKEVNFFLHLDLAATLISWSCLWAIKVSFLLLYRRIFQVSIWFTRAWWAVAAFVGLTFWVMIAGSITQCGYVGHIESAGEFSSCSKMYQHSLMHKEYCDAASMIQRQKIFVIYSCVLNILTDIASKCLPVKRCSETICSPTCTDFV